MKVSAGDSSLACQTDKTLTNGCINCHPTNWKSLYVSLTVRLRKLEIASSELNGSGVSGPNYPVYTPNKVLCSVSAVRDHPG